MQSEPNTDPLRILTTTKSATEGGAKVAEKKKSIILKEAGMGDVTFPI